MQTGKTTRRKGIDMTEWWHYTIWYRYTGRTLRQIDRPYHWVDRQACRTSIDNKTPHCSNHTVTTTNTSSCSSDTSIGWVVSGLFWTLVNTSPFSSQYWWSNVSVIIWPLQPWMWIDMINIIGWMFTSIIVRDESRLRFLSPGMIQTTTQKLYSRMHPQPFILWLFSYLEGTFKSKEKQIL